MIREIGSIYELDRSMLGFDSELEDNIITAGYKANGYPCVCTVASGREAILLAIKDIEKRLGKKNGITCLIPEYTCDTVIMPFEYHEYNIDYYSVTDDMQPEYEDVAGKLECMPDVVFVHAYYGKDTLENIRPLLLEYKKNGGIIIEDMTQCAFMEPDYSADYYVMSLRKWLHAPDGGLLITDSPVDIKIMTERSDFVKSKWIALTQKSDYLSEVNSGNYEYMQSYKQEFLALNRAAESMLDDDLNIYKMSQKSLYIANSTDWDSMRKRRECNAWYLDRNLAACRSIRCPLTYNGDEAPLYYPVYSDKRDELQKRLQQEQIYAPVLWLVPPQMGCVSKKASYIYEHMLALPCDDRYSEDDMERICNVLKEC